MADTITIISKKSFRFYNPAAPKPEPTSQDDLDAQFKASVAVPANPDPQVVPAWVKTQPMYDWAVADGDIVEVVIQTPQAQVKTDAAATDAGADAKSKTGAKPAKAGTKAAAPDAVAGALSADQTAAGADTEKA